jgi:hypothetical protein
VNVTGKVSGSLLPDATVSLYRTSSVNYTVVMDEIRTTEPVDASAINSTQQFLFPCLGYGNYTFVIPGTSYNRSVGFPLPYEFECPNVTLAIAFHGGNYYYAVGTFSIVNMSLK